MDTEIRDPNQPIPIFVLLENGANFQTVVNYGEYRALCNDLADNEAHWGNANITLRLDKVVAIGIAAAPAPQPQQHIVPVRAGLVDPRAH